MEFGGYMSHSIVSRTSRDTFQEDDEQALKWAALERLPTYDRARTGLLHGVAGDFREIDLKKLQIQEKKALLNRLVGSVDKNEEYLKKLKKRIDRVSLNLPTIEIRFENLTVEAESYVGSRAIPSVFNYYLNLTEGIAKCLHIVRSRKEKFSILRNVSGIIKPGRLTLLLGPPGSGMSTLLKALSGKLDSELKISGKVTYNGHEMHEFVPPRTSAYISQYDVHLPLLTVRETLTFSAKCQGVGTGYGEMLVGPVKAFFMDNISNGLDSSTTFQIINSIRQSIHIFNKSALICLLQPPPETYELFDDIILLSEGQIVYEGPRECVLEFFESMGFRCPETKGVAEYLQEVTSRKDQRQYWVNEELPYHYVSVNEFAEAFKSFHVGRAIQRELVTPFNRSKNHPASLTRSKYGASMKELMKACFSREVTLMKRKASMLIFKTIQLEFCAIIVATVFAQAKEAS
uniref:ABC transporter domain-containing protein n=1 Tax=Fagus sylvatica TaxID=28930 RepID=A0A2N9FTW1_FAGSY